MPPHRSAANSVCCASPCDVREEEAKGKRKIRAHAMEKVQVLITHSVTGGAKGGMAKVMSKRRV